MASTVERFEELGRSIVESDGKEKIYVVYIDGVIVELYGKTSFKTRKEARDSALKYFMPLIRNYFNFELF